MNRPNRYVPEGGGGWRKAPQSQQPRRSAKPSPKYGNNKGEVLRYLKELFGQVLDEEIIESVAESCGWSADVAIESLIELSDDVCINNHSLVGSQPNQAKVGDSPRKALPYKVPKPLLTTTTLSPGMAAIKVAYQGYDDDSDDADIIMEEEEEFEVMSLGNQGLPSLPDGPSTPLQGLARPASQNCSLSDVKRGPKECRELSTIRDYIRGGHKILVLMRGCPGSGKSYLARTVVSMYVGTDPAPYIFSTDAYFSRGGRYAFDPTDLPAAHEWNQRGVAAAMEGGLSPVVVDNTNTMIWEMKSYARLAVQFGYAIELLEPTTPWRWKESELARRNSHGVARATIRNMLDRYETVTADQLITRLKLSYAAGNHPPQPCSNPVNKKTKSSPTKEKKQNIIIPTVQLEAKELPSLLAFKLKLDATPFERNGQETSSLNELEEQFPKLPVTENDRTNNIGSHDLFTDLEPLAEALSFRKVETVERDPVVTVEEVESLQSLVDVQDSVGWQLIESLDDIITVGQQTSVPGPYDGDYAPRSSHELFEEGGEALEADQDMESLEKVLGDAFDHAFNLTPDAERNGANVNTCREYVLVGPDNSLLNQKSHDEFDKRTEDVTKKVIEQVLSESVDNLLADGHNARSDSARSSGEAPTGMEENLIDTTNPFMGLLEKVDDDGNNDADVNFRNVCGIKDIQPFKDDSGEEPDTADELGDVENMFQTPCAVSETESSESGHLSPLGETERRKSKPGEDTPSTDPKRVESGPPGKQSTKLDLFSWFFTKMKPSPDLTAPHQVVNDTVAMIPATTENASAELSTGLPNKSQVGGAVPSPDGIQWKLNSSWNHSNVEDGTSQESSLTVHSDIEILNSSASSGDVIYKTPVVGDIICKTRVVEDVSSENQSCELNLKDQTVPSVMLSELCTEYTENSSSKEQEKQEFNIVSLPDNVLDSLNTFNGDFSLLDAEIPNAVQVTPVEGPVGDSELGLISSSILQEPGVDSEPCFTSSTNASTEEEPQVDSEPGLTSSSNASTEEEPLVDSEPCVISSLNASTEEEPPVDSEPGLTSSSNASTEKEPLVDSEPCVISSSNASTEEEAVVDSEPGLTGSSNASTEKEPLVDSEPCLISSSNTTTVQEPLVDTKPCLISSSNATTVQEPLVDTKLCLICSSNASTLEDPPVDTEPGLTSSFNADLEPVSLMDKAIGLDDSKPTSDSTESASVAVDNPEENISGRLGSENYQYTSAWSKMSPSNLLQDEETVGVTHLVPPAPSKLPTQDSETNTSHSDFSLIEGGGSVGVCYLSGRGRSINEGRGNEVHRTPPTIPTLDKGSMTAPEDFDSEQPDFELLVNMFPKIARELLKELFDRCQGEINWTVDLLLESGHAFEPSESLEIRFHNSEDLQVTQQLLEELDIRDMKRSMEGSVTRGFETADGSDVVFPAEEEIASASKGSPSKRGNRRQTSELSLRLKREMERNIDLNDSSYSEETLRLKKIRHGGPPRAEQRPLDVPDQESDVDAVDEEEGNVQLALDAEFLAQLQSMFGELNYPYPEGVAPVVELPVALARQIHGALMESQQQQFDMQEKYFADMIKDEEFARRLQEADMPTPDFRQIMDMELALELYKADAAKQETKDDMATRLSKRKLTELFPAVDPEMLFDVFAAHGNSFQETLEVLEASTGEPEEAVRNVMSPEALIRIERQLIERAKQESFKQQDIEEDQASSAFERSAATATSSKDQALQEAKLYREEANRQYQLRNRCYQQARDAMRNGQPAVASYYAQVGQLYKQYIDKANARAAASLLTAHTMSKSSTTLDLHYLFVVEALQALDIFLDHHISKLVDSGKNSQQLFLITGGGNHSFGGRPKIKPAVQKRLIQRCIKYSTLNHGQLRIVITRHMALSNGNTVN